MSSPSSRLSRLIEQIVEEQAKDAFAPAPKMGDISPTEEDGKERPGMAGRPKSGMDVDQHHKMLWAEGIDYDNVRKLTGRVFWAIKKGISRTDIIEKLEKAGYSDEDIYLAYHSAKIFKGQGSCSPQLEEGMFGMDQDHYNKVWADEEEPAAMELSGRVRNMLNYGLTRDEIAEQLQGEGYSQEDIYLAYHVAMILDNKEKKEGNKEFPLDEFNAMGTGAVVGYTGPLGMDLGPIYKAFWSGDEPEKKISKKKV